MDTSAVEKLQVVSQVAHPLLSSCLIRAFVSSAAPLVAMASDGSPHPSVAASLFLLIIGAVRAFGRNTCKPSWDCQTTTWPACMREASAPVLNVSLPASQGVWFLDGIQLHKHLDCFSALSCVRISQYLLWATEHLILLTRQMTNLISG